MERLRNNECKLHEGRDCLFTSPRTWKSSWHILSTVVFAKGVSLSKVTQVVSGGARTETQRV